MMMMVIYCSTCIVVVQTSSTSDYWDSLGGQTGMLFGVIFSGHSLAYFFIDFTMIEHHTNYNNCNVNGM